MNNILKRLKSSIKGLFKKAALLASSKRFRFLLFLTCAGSLSVFLFAFVVYVWTLDVTKLNTPLPEPTAILDRYGQTQARLSSSKLSMVPYSDFPEHLKQAIIAVEDRRFISHPGVDIRSTFRALTKNLFAAGYAQGGSTITQQLAKNAFLSSEKTILRKWKEWAYAFKMEQVYKKEEILAFYLNRIYFGEGNWGIKDAANYYFSKEVKELSLEESAVLAALPKAPTRYSPLANKEMALERRNIVLTLMKNQELISKEQWDVSTAAPLQVKPGSDVSKTRFASYADHVIDEAVRLYGFTEKQLLAEGLRIYTELDPAVQDAMDKVYADDRMFPESPKDQLIQSAAIILDQQTGGIRGLVGNRGDGIFRGFNRASQLRRQPGSTFKPLAVYAPALEKGYVPESGLSDRELNLNGYQPENYDHRFRGTVSMETALVQSLNVPAVWLLQQIGIPAGVDFVQRTGITLNKQDRNYALALGGISDGVSPLQMAQAYSAFANGGKMNQAHSIVKITTPDGKILAEHHKPPVTVTDPITAYNITLMLQKAVAEGTGRNASLTRPTAGKSGTTQLPDTAEFRGLGENTAKDAWFVGYTPELTAAVWLGYDKTDRNHYLSTTGGAVPAQIFKEMMSLVLLHQPAVPFKVPAGFTHATEILDNGKKEDERDNKENKEDKEDKPSKNREKGKRD